MTPPYWEFPTLVAYFWSVFKITGIYSTSPLNYERGNFTRSGFTANIFNRTTTFAPKVLFSNKQVQTLHVYITHVCIFKFKNL